MKTSTLIFFLILSCCFSNATNKIVVGNAGQGWSNGNNFSPTGLPQNGDSVTIPAGMTLNVKGNIYGSMHLLKIYIYGTMDFDPSGKLDLTVSSLVQIYTGGKITTNGSASEIISMGGVVKYNGQNDGIVTGPKFASAATAISNGIADDAGFNFGVLPVNLLSFSLKKYNNEVIISWIINPEAGVELYVIQKKTNEAWKDIKVVRLNANFSLTTSYNDKSPNDGENFYRLKLIGNDGKVEYSRVLMTMIDRKTNSTALYPNPVINQAVLTLEKKLNNGAIYIFTITGIPVYRKKILHEGQVVIDFSKFKKGLYYITISDNDLLVDRINVVLSH